MFNDFYGLFGKPFQLTPDPAFYYPSGTHRKALSYLSYGLAQGEGFMVITGEVGAGKSTLVAHLMATVDPEQLTVGHVVTSKLGAEEIVHVVAQSFGLDIEGHDKASALGEIENFLHEEARAGRRCLLVVDEAQNLEIGALEELRMLSNFQLGNHPLLQTLLLGQPEFRETLQDHAGLEQLRQRVIAAHHLEAMQENEIEPYFTHRLKHVGWDGNPGFEPGLFEELYRASGGIPRKINLIGSRLMLLGEMDQQQTLTLEMIETVVREMTQDNAVPAEAAGSTADQQSEPSQVPGFEDLLAERDGRIAELEQAVIELSYRIKDLVEANERAARTAPKPGHDEALRSEIAALGNRLEAKERQDASLRQEISALTERVDSAERNGLQSDLEKIDGKLQAMADKIDEQERTLRHTITMLIEWVEGEIDHPQAA